MDALDASYKKETFTDNEYSSTSDVEKPSPHIPATADLAPLNIEITYPEGGRDAWLVVLGAWCGLTSSLGIYNTSGVFEVVISKVILPEASSSTLGWIFSVYAFVNWVCGVQIGPTFDAMGPRALMVAGTICTLVGIFTLSVSTEYYQIFLSFSVMTGIGSSLLLTPSMGCVAHWFMERRGLASGIAFIGGGFGGVLFPLMIQSLLPQVGWGWSIRILGFVLFVLCAISVAFCRSRIPPRKGTETTWRDTLPDYKIFLDGTGAMALTTAGVLLTDLAYFIPITYIPRYYIDRQHLSDEEALTGSSAFAYQLLAILNSASCVGRYVAGDMADRFGRYNTMIVSLFFCTVSVLGFWLPDILAPDLDSYALLVVFILLFGFCSGSNPSTSISSDQFQTSHARWRALTHRTPSSHSSFLYGVKSTKIYCRPTCPARLDRRANVVFYDTEDQARRDGHRPCKRCQPDNASFVGEKEEVVTRVLALLRTKRGDHDLTVKRGLKELAQEVGVTPSYLCRVFKRTMGLTLGAYMREFEREVIEGKTEREVQYPITVGSGMVDAATGLWTPETTAGSPMAPVEGPKEELAEQQVGNVAEALDLNFDFDEWFWAGGFIQEDFWHEGALNDSLHTEALNDDVPRWNI
ncbi:hypothetical protein PENSOL_c028G07857 [Penicillium solitum]|uniref:HTH araC/xylS-type domain-containing protein n=1 Tax=Penicillium solitum TaxID=60172 RepID=A0A1V6QXZ2_9EURO|nr:uncharacterized protein PENSOL_c028G07857 [Penicillium solitum]OQD94063.1 hypothetical protein PENSOL_c028G07857 [Penicillium solitum]